MPRPNKPISSGRLEDPVSNSRGSTWAKHAGPEHSDQYEPDGALLIDALTQETVAHVDLTAESEPMIEIREAPSPTVDALTPPASTTYRWESNRTIDGRIYHRLDTKVVVASD